MNLKKSVVKANAVIIGNFAIALLAQSGIGRVMGVTSHGFFLLTQYNRVIFISTESLLGPVHIIITTLPEEIKTGLMGAEVECSPEKLYIPQTGFQINLKNAEVWQPPALPRKIQAAQERHRQIKSIANKILESKREASFLPLLKWIITPALLPKSSDHKLTEFIQKTADLQQSVKENEPIQAGRILDSFLCYGPGLTPSGDDFVWGFLAALNRWQVLLCPQFEAGRLNEMILPAAQQRTTFLSTTLIECAVHGWADANMLAVLDCLFTGIGSVDDVVQRILAYGSSSGVDAFTGMLAAVNTSKN